MNQTEIFEASQQELRNRLVVVDYSTIPEQLREAKNIRRELSRRTGHCVQTGFLEE